MPGIGDTEINHSVFDTEINDTQSLPIRTQLSGPHTLTNWWLHRKERKAGSPDEGGLNPREGEFSEDILEEVSKMVLCGESSLWEQRRVQANTKSHVHNWECGMTLYLLVWDSLLSRNTVSLWLSFQSLCHTVLLSLSLKHASLFCYHPLSQILSSMPQPVNSSSSFRASFKSHFLRKTLPGAPG